jgi:hypothetical protein
MTVECFSKVDKAALRNIFMLIYQCSQDEHMGSVVELVVSTNTVLNLLNHMIKSNHIISLLLNM